jgi:GT2 family glycosyltransferase
MAVCPGNGRLMVWLVATSMRIGRLAAGCYLFCTREAFEAAGGFDERLFATEELALSRALGRLGRVAILRESVESSGRKLRTHTGWEILRVTTAILGRASTLRSRERLDLWYGARRVDHETGA